MTKQRYVKIKDITSDEDKNILAFAKILSYTTNGFIDYLGTEFNINKAKEITPIIMSAIVNYIHHTTSIMLTNIMHESRKDFIEMAKKNICDVLDRALHDLNVH